MKKINFNNLGVFHCCKSQFLIELESCDKKFDLNCPHIYCNPQVQLHSFLPTLARELDLFGLMMPSVLDLKAD